MKVVSITVKAVFVVLIGLASKAAVADAADWLMKINAAASGVNFSGTFVYIHDGKIESMEVARRIKGGMMEERLYSLNGPPREIIRGMNKVWCYIPDQNVVVHDYRQITQSGFPKILPSDLEQLTRNYRFSEGRRGRIADRTAQQINIIPNDSYRYGYNLWADTESGLLLQSDLINQQNEVVEQYTFVTVEIGGDISDEQLVAVSDKDELQLFGNNTPISTPAESSAWQVTQIPDGYVLNKHIRRMSPMDAGEVEHLVYTDGLSTVSVFIKKTREGQSDMNGLSKMGAVHAYRKTMNNHRITVMGEVPAVTVKFLAMGIEHSI
jgi:sigma-E factor negative regulatory protein RseB